MTSGILKEYNLVVYPVNVAVSVDMSTDKLNRKYKRIDGNSSLPGIPSDADAYCCTVKNRKTNGLCELINLNSETCNMSVVTHEAVHAALDIFYAVEAEIDFDNQEPFCYLVSTITRLTESTIDKLQKKTKSKNKKKNGNSK